MSKGWSYIIRIGICGVVGVVIYVLFQLLLALMVVNGHIPENQTMVMQSISGGFSSLLACAAAVKLTGWRTACVATSAIMVLLVLLSGFVIYDSIVLGADIFLRLGAMLFSGVIICLLANGKRSARKRKRVVNGMVGRRK